MESKEEEKIKDILSMPSKYRFINSLHQQPAYNMEHAAKTEQEELIEERKKIADAINEVSQNPNNRGIGCQTFPYFSVQIADDLITSNPEHVGKFLAMTMIYDGDFICPCAIIHEDLSVAVAELMISAGKLTKAWYKF